MGENPVEIALKGAPRELLLEIASKTMLAFNSISDIKELVREQFGLLHKRLDTIERRLNGEKQVSSPKNAITGENIATCPECKEKTLHLVGTKKLNANEVEVWKCYNPSCHYKGARE